MSPRYAEWLQFVFDRPTPDPTQDPWYFDDGFEDFDAESPELADLVATTFEHCGRDLAKYSDGQIRYGLSYMLENSCSNVVYALKDDDIPMALRLRAIAAMKNLYSGVFEPRCAPVLGHRSEAGNALNYICYMLWDSSPMSYWEPYKDKQVFYGAVADVMAHALRSSNPACVEGGLHGLGHIHLYYPGRVEDIIDTFLAHGAAQSPALRQYAQAARKGHVL